MARFFTADLHLSHRNIIKYCNRPFVDVQEMDESLLYNAWEVVKPDDELWVLGDLALGELEKSLGLASRLPGIKTLLIGNHDRPFGLGPGAKRDDRVKLYEDAGFTVIIEPWILDEIGGHEVVLSHFPYSGDSHDADRYTEFRPVDKGLPLIHGHVHNSWQHRDHEFNVGVDVNFFTPVHEEMVAFWLDEKASKSPA